MQYYFSPSSSKTLRSDSKSQETILIVERTTNPTGETEERKYIRGNLLGIGGFAKVYIVTEMATNKRMAGKIIPKSSVEGTDYKQKLIAEISAQKVLKHPSIVQLERAFEDKENIYILLELCSNQTLNDLFQKKKRFTESETRQYMRQLIIALKFVHSQKIIHRDIKLNNLFLTENMDLKLGDFGVSVKLKTLKERRKSVCGTPNYIAPEVLNRTGHSFQADIWSLGVITYQLLVGMTPFENPDKMVVFKKIKEANFSFPPDVSLSDEAKDLISSILVLKPEDRPTLDDILLHPFFDAQHRVPGNDYKLARRITLCGPTSSHDPMNKRGSMEKSAIRVSDEKQTYDKRMLKSSSTSANLRPVSVAPSPKDFSYRDSPIHTEPNQGFATPTNLINSIIKVPSNKETQKCPNCYAGAGVGKGNLEWADLNISNNGRDTNAPWIVKWLDYASKYGMGYVLSDGVVGVIFNDQSKIVCQYSSNDFIYIEECKTDKNGKSFGYNFERYPNHLDKKVSIYRHFREYLKNNQSGVSIVPNMTKFMSDPSKKWESPSNEAPMYGPARYKTFVTKWIKTKHAIFFKLNSKAMQIIFKDGVTIMINQSTTTVEYIDKDGKKGCQPLGAPRSTNNQDIVKRILYVQETLQDIWKGKSVEGIDK